MSIELAGKSRNRPEEWIHSPVSSESMWEEFWSPIAKELGLERISKWELGEEFYAKDIPAVIWEFEAINGFVMNNPDSRRYWERWEPGFQDRFSQRIKQIVDLLSEYKDNDDYVWLIWA